MGYIDLTKLAKKAKKGDKVNKLDYELRILIVLYYYKDMSLKSISEILNIPEGTAKSRLSRARGCLKKYLSDSIRSVL